MLPSDSTAPSTESATRTELARAICDAVLSDWPIPVSEEINPAGEAAGARHLAWLDEFGLVGGDRNLTDLRTHEVTAYAYPYADINALTLVTDWTDWLFVVDDLFDEGPAGTTPTLAADLLDFVRGHTRMPLIADDTNTPLLTSLRHAGDDLWQRTRTLMPPNQLAAFTSHMDAYYDALVEQSRYRQHRAIPTVDDYCRIRRFSSGAPPQIDFVEQSESVRLPDMFYNTTEYAELVGTAADIGGWINDVFSAAKEYMLGDTHNLVIVLHHRDGASLVDAARLATRMIAEHITRMTLLAESTPATLSMAGLSPKEIENVERWIQGLYRFNNHAAWYLHNHYYATDELQA